LAKIAEMWLATVLMLRPEPLRDPVVVAAGGQQAQDFP
jgi:hypothetical protein